MQHLPRITVITPSFNQVRFLERTIVSVLDQGYDGLQYIVADGGSCDGSVDVIRRYEGELTPLLSAGDSGPADAIARAMQQATGDLVAILPADDLYLPLALHRVAMRFMGADEPDWMIAGVQPIDANDRVIDRPAPPQVATLSQCLRCGIDATPASATFYRRQALDYVGPIERALRHAHLFEINCRLMAAGLTPTRFDQTIAQRRIHATSMSARDPLGRRHEESRVVWRHIHDRRPLTPRIRVRDAIRPAAA